MKTLDLRPTLPDLLMALLLTIAFIAVETSCRPRLHQAVKPKFGDVTAPVGPSKDAFKQ